MHVDHLILFSVVQCNNAAKTMVAPECHGCVKILSKIDFGLFNGGSLNLFLDSFWCKL